jgi:hypothetical protein
MIRLSLPDKPVELSAEVEAALIAEFKATKKAVWHESFIRTRLLEMTASKCAYCERQLGEGVNMTKRESQFSALAATVLLHSPDFEQAKNCLVRLGDWHDGFDQLLIQA